MPAKRWVADLPRRTAPPAMITPRRNELMVARLSERTCGGVAAWRAPPSELSQRVRCFEAGSVHSAPRPPFRSPLMYARAAPSAAAAAAKPLAHNDESSSPPPTVLPLARAGAPRRPSAPASQG
eukprot:scaffold1293_cov375-Prasinococcus_capsulatus_cf.AAC.12